MKKTDIGVGVALILLSVLVFVQAGTYAKATIYGYGPDFYPRILAVAMIVCGLILILQAARGKALEPTESIDPKGFVQMLLSIGLCIGYLFLMQVIGFAMATMVFLFVMMLFLRQRGGIKRIICSITVALAVWAIFRYILITPIPKGMFAFTF